MIIGEALKGKFIKKEELLTEDLIEGIENQERLTELSNPRLSLIEDTE
jgi:hypothetical protein